MEERCRHKSGGVCFGHNGHESGVVSQPAEKLEGQPVHPQRVLEPRVDGAGIDKRDESQLRNPSQPAERRRIEQGSHPGRERHGVARGYSHALPADVEGDEFRQLGNAHGDAGAAGGVVGCGQEFKIDRLRVA